MSVELARFEESEESLGLREFFKRYRHTLPQVLKVEEGFCSSTDIDTLSRDQVIFVSTYVTQSRVLALETGGRGQLLSLPKNYPILLRVLGTSTGDRKHPLPLHFLENIVEQHTLPVEAEMMTPPISHPVVGPDGSEVSLFPRLRLTDLFSEMYLVGHSVDARKDDLCFSGKLYTQPISVPLYLNHVTVTRVLGIVGMSQAKWHLLLEKMAAKVQDLHLNVDLTSPDLIIYSENTQFLQQTPGKARRKEENVYDSLVPTAVVNLQTQTQTLPRPRDRPRKSVVPGEKETPSSSDKEEAVSAHYGILGTPSHRSTYEALKPTPPPLPQRVRAIPPPDHSNPSSSAKPSGHVTSITIQARTSHSGSSMEHREPRPPPPLPPSRLRVLPPTPGQRESHVDDKRPVESLTISEVCEKLRLLNLGHHQGEFRTQMVDGAVLSRMKMEDLKSDFNMTSAEAIRLMLYVTKGHIPK